MHAFLVSEEDSMMDSRRPNSGADRENYMSILDY